MHPLREIFRQALASLFLIESGDQPNNDDNHDRNDNKTRPNTGLKNASNGFAGTK